jgi:tetratricopeptide (TPR) repeat protein
MKRYRSIAGLSIFSIAALVAPGCETVTIEKGSDYMVTTSKTDSVLDVKLKTLQEDAEKYPKRHDIHYQIAIVHSKKGDLREAAKALEKAVEIAPDEAKYHYELGRAYKGMKELDLAEKHFREATLHVPVDRYTGFHAALGDVLAEKKDWMGALAQFESCIRIDPNDTQYYYVVGSLYDIMGRREDAIRNLEEYLVRGGETYRKNTVNILERLGVVVEKPLESTRPRPSSASEAQAKPVGTTGG